MDERPKWIDVRSEVDEQRRVDRAASERGRGPQAVLRGRMGTVLGAQKAIAAGEPEAVWELRAGLVALAAICESLVESLPAPPREPQRPGG